MVEQDDWRLLHDVKHLKKAEIIPTDGEEICRHAPQLKHCNFCFTSVQNNSHQRWFVPNGFSCCICEDCYHDFQEMFAWKKLDGWDIDWEMKP